MKSDAAKYSMTISRLTVDKLGVKLYDKVSAVIAELIANAYDADATSVNIRAPLGTTLATKRGGALEDKGLEIVVADNGHGMTPEEVNAFYLKVGGERRKDSARGDRTRSLKRKVMGRKGVGKLAPFGICERIELETAGGDLRTTVEGKELGYIVSHLILDRSQILTDSEQAYHPEIGSRDGEYDAKPGTKLVLSKFSKRMVPAVEELERQLAQRFGIPTPNWQINIVDTSSGSSEPRIVGKFEIPKSPGTEIRLELKRDFPPTEASSYAVITPDDKVLTRTSDGKPLQAGFEFEGRFYPVVGWVAYSKEPYRDELMAGIRIYCRGKIAAQTALFNRRSGFTGEFNIRSYLVGQLEADWLDEEEDLIQTDRRDILWSDDLCQAFQQWGQELVVNVGTLSREPMKKKIWERFREKSDIDNKISKMFPGDAHEPIRKRADELAQLLGKTLREDELDDKATIDSLVQLTLNFAPHLELTAKMREAASDSDSPLEMLSSLLRTARIAELSAFGSIAHDRVEVIRRLEVLKDGADTAEDALQKLLEDAPWLINPHWSPVTANESFNVLRTEFLKLYKAETDRTTELADFDPSITKKRPDFVMTSVDGRIEIIEIKRPHHKLTDEEFERINTYYDVLAKFLHDRKNEDFMRLFQGGFHITLVCDGIALKSVAKKAFDKFVNDEELEHIGWTAFLRRTRQTHEAFLKEAERQRKLAVKER